MSGGSSVCAVRLIQAKTQLNEMKSLFRPEAVEHSTRRLAGEVVLASPLSAKLVGLILSAIVLGALVFAAIATYARPASLATGWSPTERTVRHVIRAVQELLPASPRGTSLRVAT